MALAAPGDLDPTFGTGGMVTTHITGGVVDVAFGVAVQADGKIITVGGSFSPHNSDFAVARYNTDGSLDTTFGTGGTVTTHFEDDGTGNPWAGDDVAHGVAVQTDGKIVVVGSGAPGVATEFGLARYNTDGSLDTAFGTGGKVTTDFSSGAVAFGVALQTDGKIVAVGSGLGGFGLARYNIDGSLDTAFGTGGKVTTDFDGGATAFGMALQTDGKIVAAGLGGPNDNRDFALARFNSDGSLDTAFGTGGKVTTDFDGDAAAYGVAVQADGKIIAVGGNGWDFALARYQGDGGAPAGVDVSVAKAGPTTVKLGHRISYTVTVTNTSTASPATGLTLTDTLTGPGQLQSATPSQGTCTPTTTSASCAMGTLAPGASATVTVVVKPTATGTISNTATAHAAEPDPAQENNTATATTTVNPKKCHPGKQHGAQRAGEHTSGKGMRNPSEEAISKLGALVRASA
ncbi:DUF11 domain-containing protein [Streptomyces sp. TRM49041]|uniref:DUF7933 domain-containing protein n=1 Tax=Streptomyces sp. TRM49041 TaxID=2603216 RepID=UPI0016568468|nr:DUF11 domain-containing protein [Streptomyces sp. TRM49041]